jgi:hypothetical protein
MTSSGQAFYDISLVDGYNLPLGIQNLFSQSRNSTLQDIPPNLTNPICIGTSSLITDVTSAADAYFGTNSTYPLPLEQHQTRSGVGRWCPWDLQVQPPQKPGDGVYPYPDDNIIRPIFDPCYSACSKSGSSEDCCTGDYDSPDKCSPNIYSTAAKAVCPDAYSYGKFSNFFFFFLFFLCVLGKDSNDSQLLTIKHLHLLCLKVVGLELFSALLVDQQTFLPLWVQSYMQ